MAKKSCCYIYLLDVSECCRVCLCCCSCCWLCCWLVPRVHTSLSMRSPSYAVLNIRKGKQTGVNTRKRETGGFVTHPYTLKRRYRQTDTHTDRRALTHLDSDIYFFVCIFFMV